MGTTRNEILLALRRRNIGASVHYAPLHMMGTYQRVGPASLPHTERLAERIITLPISASMSMADVDYVAGHLTDLLAAAKSARVAS
jgi:dTDP-4-amino-4,6-dideoxygalactose transaminase